MKLTPQGQQVVDNLAQRYGVSTDAVTTLLQAVLNGSGTMAQFSHPELGGSGQWMQGGMTMVGDMFNNNLKYLVDNLCSELSQQLAAQQLIQPAANPPSYGGQYQGQGVGSNSFAMNTQQWWPSDLGSPSASGAQNNLRYAYFADQRRLALEINGQVSVYDTQDHQIGGFSQQQGYGASILLSSQYGTVDVLNLPLISGPGTLQANQTASTNTPEPAAQMPASSNNGNQGMGGESESDIFAKIERLADLKQKGILSEDEFNSKKADLLSRI